MAVGLKRYIAKTPHSIQSIPNPPVYPSLHWSVNRRVTAARTSSMCYSIPFAAKAQNAHLHACTRTRTHRQIGIASASPHNPSGTEDGTNRKTRGAETINSTEVRRRLTQQRHEQTLREQRRKRLSNTPSTRPHNEQNKKRASDSIPKPYTSSKAVHTKMAGRKAAHKKEQKRGKAYMAAGANQTGRTKKRAGLLLICSPTGKKPPDKINSPRYPTKYISSDFIYDQ